MTFVKNDSTQIYLDEVCKKYITSSSKTTGFERILYEDVPAAITFIANNTNKSDEQFRRRVELPVQKQKHEI